MSTLTETQRHAALARNHDRANELGMEPGASMTSRLYGTVTFEEGPDTIRATLFGAMLDVAAPVVESYRSDFYRDVQILNERVNGPCQLVYSYDSFGTWLCRADDNDLAPTFVKGRKNAVLVDLWHDGDDDGAELWQRRGDWYATVTPVTAKAS